MTIPRYVLRNLVQPRGRRLPKVTREEFVCFCPGCRGKVFKKPFQGTMQVEGHYKNGVYWHYQCLKPVVTLGPVIAEFEAGNLAEEEYRYWIGYREPKSVGAICRACRTSIYGDEKERRAHFADPNYVVAEEPCSKQLTRVYDKLRDIRPPVKCVVCHQDRWGHDRWGVPICRQLACINSWKFDTSVKWIAVEAGIRRLRVEAKLAKKQADEAAGFCTICKVKKSVYGHEEMHKGYLMMQARADIEEDKALKSQLDTMVGEGCGDDEFSHRDWVDNGHGILVRAGNA